MANVKISELPTATNVSPSDTLPFVQGGVTKQAAKSVLLDNLGTPSVAVLTNATGLPISTGVAGLGTGVASALAVNVGSAGAPVVNGGALGTPSSGVATNLTGLPLTTGVTGTLPVANGGTGATSSTGSGNVVLSASPTLTGTTIVSALTASGNVSFDGGVFVFNESGADKDARFEGDTDANLLFLDASTDRVGIGTATPAAKLAIDAGVNALAINLNSTNANGVHTRFQNSGTSIGDLGAAASVLSSGVAGDFAITSRSGNLVFGTGTNERMRLDSSGNFSIGAASPSGRLDAAIMGTARLIVGSGGNSENYYDANTQFWRNGAGSSEFMRLDSSGNIIHRVNGAAPTLSANSTMSFELTSNTSLKIVVRGTDGTTRSVSLTLA